MGLDLLLAIDMGIVIFAASAAIIALFLVIHARISLKKKPKPGLLLIVLSFIIYIADILIHEGDEHRLVPLTGSEIDLLHSFLHVIGTVIFVFGVNYLIRDQFGYQETFAKQLTKLRKAYRKMRSLDELKSNFIQNIAHDLKTPLSVAITAHDLMDKARTKKDRDKFEEIFNRNLYRLRDEIENVLELYKTEHGKRYEKTLVDLSEIIHSVVAQNRPIAEKKGLRIIEEVENLPVVIGDPKALYTLVENIVENATKFTKNGKITVTAKAKDRKITVSITDTGPGILKKKQVYIFHRFYKADPLSPGSGIGLSICRHIVKGHGGRITFKSIKGNGTTFTFVIPIRHS